MWKKLLRIVGVYIGGFGLYKLILHVTQTVLLGILGLQRNEIDILWDDIRIDIYLYTILVSFVSFVLYICDKINR